MFLFFFSPLYICRYFIVYAVRPGQLCEYIYLFGAYILYRRIILKTDEDKNSD